MRSYPLLNLRSHRMKFESQNYTIEVIDEQAYACGSSSNLHTYSQEYNLEPKYRPSSSYGVKCVQSDANCIVLASGGASAITEQSVIFRDSVFWILIGDQLVCFALPTLELLWNKKIDSATGFELFLSPDGKGLLIHGELEISKVTFEGETIWNTSGKDIFTEEFFVYEKHIEATDFNGEKYHIKIDDGVNTLIKV